ncbi:hypothetical protein B5X24_HaOG210181 [Helicoverpa armigera]|uniref:Uncharacterized protein n=1 Tax=Helicoverpa armigera TaxID=29058 RepID=A0A2W1BJV7_HELAM|nr:hypothetical protein B5X24_HaOG210181 [Helicoverpa armigera]
MDTRILFILSCAILTASAWSRPFYPVRGPMRFTRFAPPPPAFRPHHHPSHLQLHSQPHAQAPAHLPQHRTPVESAELEEPQWQRPKRGHDDYDHDHDHRGTSGVTGPVHTFVKTDKNANYKWGVRHHVGDKYAS